MKNLPFYSSRIMFLLYIILVVSNRFLSLLIPIFTQNLIDAIPLNHLDTLKFYGIINFVIVLLFIFSLSAANYVQECYENAKLLLKKIEYAEQINKLPYEKFYQNSFGYFLQRFNSDIENCRPFIINKPVQFWVQGIYLIFIVFFMLSIDVTYSILLFSVFPLIVFFYKKLASKVGIISKEIENTQDQINSHFEEMLYCNHALRTSSASNWYVSRMDGIIKENFSLRKRCTSIETVYDFVLITGLLNILSVAVYYLGGILVFNNQITMGMVISMSLYYSKLWSPLEFYLDYPKEKAKFEMYRKRIQEVYNKSENTSYAQLQHHSISEMERINIQKLKYSIGEKIIFDDFSLSIRKGDKIGIIGSNGSGKTTLANLICGLLKNYSGRITYNGIDYHDIESDELIKHICLIPATPQLFSGTVGENITLGSSEQIPGYLLDILYKQNLYPDKLLLEHGGNLSGGEAKLIQLMRGIYRQCDLYIVDEPLNYIDKEYTSIMIKIIGQLFIDKTLIIISHDTKAFDLCKMFITIQDGKAYKSDDYITSEEMDKSEARKI